MRLDRLVGPGDARSIRVRSVTGYPVRLPVRDLGRVWLALEVGGAPFSRGHGFPLRLVAPGRRGFWWVKWVQDVERSALPWWVQSPRHDNVLVDTARVPALLAAEGLRAEVRPAFGDERLPAGLRAIVATRPA